MSVQILYIYTDIYPNSLQPQLPSLRGAPEVWSRDPRYARSRFRSLQQDAQQNTPNWPNICLMAPYPLGCTPKFWKQVYTLNCLRIELGLDLGSFVNKENVCLGGAISRDTGGAGIRVDGCARGDPLGEGCYKYQRLEYLMSKSIV